VSDDCIDRAGHGTRDELLEAIWRSAEAGDHSMAGICSHCDVEFGDADLEALEHAGLVVRSRAAVALSAAGLQEAARLIRRHRLADALLSTFLRLKRADVDAIACDLEHTLLPEVEEAICTLLGHPAVCPDGKPIPEGSCCTRDQRTIGRIVTRLNELRPGERARVTYIRPASHAHLHQLLAFGLSPGVVVTVHAATPTVCVRFDSTELALDAEIAACIFVVRVADNEENAAPLRVARGGSR